MLICDSVTPVSVTVSTGAGGSGGGPGGGLGGGGDGSTCKTAIAPLHDKLWQSCWITTVVLGPVFCHVTWLPTHPVTLSVWYPPGNTTCVSAGYDSTLTCSRVPLLHHAWLPGHTEPALTVAPLGTNCVTKLPLRAVQSCS